MEIIKNLDLQDAICMSHHFSKKNSLYSKNGEVLAAKFLLCTNDDIITACYVGYLYHLIYQMHGFYPKVICIGSNNELSKRLFEGKTEAQVLKETCGEMHIPYTNILAIEYAPNDPRTTEILNFCIHDVAIMVLTERNSVFFVDKTKKEDCYQKMHFHVLPHKDEDVFCYYNGKGLCNGLAYLHEMVDCLGSNNEINQSLTTPVYKKNFERLSDRYSLKTDDWNLPSFFDFIKLLRDLKRNKQKIKNEQEELIQKWREKIEKELNHF